MKTQKSSAMMILALGGLLATPPAILSSHSKIQRTIASVIEYKAPEEKLEVKVPDLKRSEIRVAGDLDPNISDVEKFELKHEKIADIALPGLKEGELKMSHPRYDKLVELAKDKKLTDKVEVDLKKFKAKRLSVYQDLVKLKKDTSAKKKDHIQSLVIDLLLVEETLEALQEKKAIAKADTDSSLKQIEKTKDEIELMLLDLETPEEKRVAKSSSESSVEEEKEAEEKSEAACDKDEKISVLSKQIDKLIEDQSKIMQSMLSMTQMMMMNMMLQQQQSQQNPMSNWNAFNNLYQYNQPHTAGNWVYYPQGFQPGQQNIFQQPQPQLTQYQQSFYPDQVHQSSWGLQPSMNFNTSSMVTPGTFGGSGMTFDMSNSVPTISQR